MSGPADAATMAKRRAGGKSRPAHLALSLTRRRPTTDVVSMTSTDRLTHLHFPQLGVKGAIVELDRSLTELPSYRHYPVQAQRLLGEAIAAAALLHANVKGRSRIGLQLQSQSSLRLLYAECSESGAVRGLAQLREHSDAPALDQLGSDAILAITLESAAQGDRAAARYQGIVPLIGSRLDAVLEHYFAASEQLPSKILLAADGARARGLLLQKLPGADPAEVDQDGWDRTTHLMATVSAQELLTSARDDLLFRLFHEEQLALVDGLQLRFACTCSRERVNTMFQALGKDEAMLAATEDGRASVQCEFCGRRYGYDRIELEALFHPLVSPASPAEQ